MDIDAFPRQQKAVGLAQKDLGPDPIKNETLRVTNKVIGIFQDLNFC